MSKEQPSLYIHIGLPKTASTYLQHKVFPALRGIHYLGTPAGAPFAGRRDQEHGRRTLTSCFQRSATIWDALGSEIVSALVGSEPRTPSTHSILVSDEGVGREATRPELFRAHLEGLKRCAIRSGFPRLRILCFIRRQDHWLASHYAQVSDRNADASQSDFELTVREILDPARGRFAFGMLLDFATIYHQLADVLATDDILMLPYENLTGEPACFLSRIGSFLPNNADLSERLHDSRGIQRGVNVRTRGKDTWLLRPPKSGSALRAKLKSVLRNTVRQSVTDGCSRSNGSSEIVLTTELSATILGEFRVANMSLAEQLKIDLSRYGYY